jgi:uncharacterized membrane protein
VALSWARGLLALGLTLPTTLYQYYVFKADAVFHKRAEVPTPSPQFRHYILGYGLVFALALVALVWLWARRSPPLPPVLGEPEGKDNSSPVPPELGARGPSSPFRNTRTALFAVCWAVGGFVAAYLPLAFQRKMLMGEHVPLCLLAGAGAALLARRFAPRRQAVVLVLLVLASFPSNFLFLRRDVRHLERNRSETSLRPFLPETLYQTYGWIRHNLPPNASVLGMVTECAPLPGETGRSVWVGHWGETPNFGTKLNQVVRFFDARSTDDARRKFLAETGAGYLLYPNALGGQTYFTRGNAPHTYVDFQKNTPPYLSKIYANKDYTVFRIDAGK